MAVFDRRAICDRAIEGMRAEFGEAFFSHRFDYGNAVAVGLRFNGKNAAWKLMGTSGGGQIMEHSDECRAALKVDEDGTAFCMGGGCKVIGLHPISYHGLSRAMTEDGATAIVFEILREMRAFCSEPDLAVDPQHPQRPCGSDLPNPGATPGDLSAAT